MTRLENAGEAARQRKDFDLAIKCYEAAVNWQPCRTDLWQHLATALADAGASKEVGLLLDFHARIHSFLIVRGT